MKIVVKAKTGAKEERVKLVRQPHLGLPGFASDEFYHVSVKERPVQGAANEAIIAALAQYFNIARGRITLHSGATSKTKVFLIE